MITINYLAVLVAAIGSMILGALWYGPLFGKKWSEMMGWSTMSPEQTAEMKKGATKSYLWMFLGSLVTAYVMAHVVWAFKAMDFSTGLQAGFWMWLGFIATTTLGSVLWEGKSMKLWLLNHGYNMLNLCWMGVLLAIWQ